MSITEDQTENPVPPGEVGAWFDIPDEKTVIRIRNIDPETSIVELFETGVLRAGRGKHEEKHRIPVFEGNPVEATKIYNHMLVPFQKLELAAAKEILEEAKAQGDKITVFNQRKYINELEEDLGIN